MYVSHHERLLYLRGREMHQVMVSQARCPCIRSWAVRSLLLTFAACEAAGLVRMLLSMQTLDRSASPYPESARLPHGVRRDQIIAAAAALFKERGYRGASMRDIGEQVGLLKGSLYVHVSNKEEILLEIVSTMFRQFMAALEPIAAQNMPASSRCRRGVEAHLGTIAEHPNSAYVFMHEARHLEGQPGLWVQEAHARYRAVWEGIFRAGVEDGEFRCDLDIEAASVLILSACDWSGRHPSLQPLSAHNLAERYCGVLLSGCLAHAVSR